MGHKKKKKADALFAFETRQAERVFRVAYIHMYVYTVCVCINVDMFACVYLGEIEAYSRPELS